MKQWNDLEWWGSEWEMLEHLYRPDYTALPPREQLYRALELTPFSEVKCVILGQDPYPSPLHACGLAFSVPPEVKALPPTLGNIFTEYARDLHYPTPRNGDLSSWARSGVLLLNSVLTVEPRKPGSHRRFGWQSLTGEIINALATHKPETVFILWGAHADTLFTENTTPDQRNRVRVVRSPHPSPLSAHRGFFGSRPFTRANGFLGPQAVNWRLP